MPRRPLVLAEEADAYTATVPRTLEIVSRATLLSNLLRNFDTASASLVGLTCGHFHPRGEHAVGVYEFFTMMRSSEGLLSESDVSRAIVLLGMGKRYSIPAAFWSSLEAFDSAALNLAVFYGFPPSNPHRRHFIRYLVNETAQVRWQLYRAGAFVGWLPIQFRTDEGPPANRSQYREYCDRWRRLPRTAAFYFSEWESRVLVFDTQESGSGSERLSEDGSSGDLEGAGDSELEVDSEGSPSDSSQATAIAPRPPRIYCIPF